MLSRIIEGIIDVCMAIMMLCCAFVMIVLVYSYLVKEIGSL